MPLIKKPKIANHKFGGQADKPVRFHEYKSEITRFSYKGVVIERNKNTYRITPPKLKGFDMALCDGVYTDTRSLQGALDLAFLNVDSERQEELRALNINHRCPACKGVTLIQKRDWQEERISCPLCARHSHYSYYEAVKDEVIR